jgi:hypothetical protein
MTLCVLTTNQPATAPLLLSLSVSCRRPTSYHAEPHYFISAVVVSFGKSTLYSSTAASVQHPAHADARGRWRWTRETKDGCEAAHRDDQQFNSNIRITMTYEFCNADSEPPPLGFFTYCVLGDPQRSFSSRRAQFDATVVGRCARDSFLSLHPSPLHRDDPIRQLSNIHDPMMVKRPSSLMPLPSSLCCSVRKPHDDSFNYTPDAGMTTPSEHR